MSFHLTWALFFDKIMCDNTDCARVLAIIVAQEAHEVQDLDLRAISFAPAEGDRNLL